MALDPRKRQKKQEKRNARAKVKHQQIARRNSLSEAEKFHLAARGPFVHSYVSEGIGSGGMGTCIVSRETSSGMLAFATFLIDADCLGVKDVFSGLQSQRMLEEGIIDGIGQRENLIQRPPEYVCKLVTEAVAFANQYGLRPHSDYHKASLIFQGVDPTACTTEFTFGREGKPFYVQGPYDSAERVAEIMQAIGQSGSPKYILNADPSNLPFDDGHLLDDDDDDVVYYCDEGYDEEYDD